MSDLPKRLRIKASMIALGERVAWGSDTALMEEAADVIEALSASVENHQLHMLGMARDRDQLRALLSEQPQASAAQSAHHNLLGELYQVLGALDAPDNVLDNVSAAIHDEPLPHATLLPFVVSAQSAPAGAVLMPPQCTDRAQHVKYRNGWNSCLSEVARLNRVQSMPENWKTVPVKPTISMVEAGYEASLGMPDRSGHARAIEMFDAMLAAAPAQPAAQDQGEVQRLREALEKAAIHVRPTCKALYDELCAALAASTGQEVEQ